MPKGNDPQQRSTGTALVAFVRRRRLNWLLLFVPLSLLIGFLHLSELWLFFASAVAIIPLAALLGEATEQLANRVGPGLGGFLNATFGNATELIIALAALRSGLQQVVKATLSGSFIGNILLALGLSMLVGGWGRSRQTFNRVATGANAAMLFLAVVALALPAVFDLAVLGTLSASPPVVFQFSLLVSLVLLATYLAGLVFSLRTHRDLIRSVTFEPQVTELTTRQASVLLLFVTILTAVEGELLVSSIATVTAILHLTQFFVGVVLVAIVGNAAEYYSALSMSRLNRMDLAMGIAAGSATQIALFVTPVLVLASFPLGQPLSIIFTPLEIAGATFAVLAFAIVALDGESNWFEGVELIAVYLVLAIIFYFVPAI